jgi:hypothetical protein
MWLDNTQFLLFSSLSQETNARGMVPVPFLVYVICCVVSLSSVRARAAATNASPTAKTSATPANDQPLYPQFW